MRKILHQGNHPDITNSLSNIGLAYGQLGDISKKLKYLEEVLKIRQALYQGNHPDIAASFTNIGVAYGQLGDISKGLKYFG